MPNIGRFRAILGSQQGLSGPLNGSLGLNGTVGRSDVLRSPHVKTPRRFAPSAGLPMASAPDVEEAKQSFGGAFLRPATPRTPEGLRSYYKD